ncbi:MAG: AAA family ATPase [Planctomycetia bacterium]|nr:AAA family ATPase [Planctomycetia bacterium]
MKVTQLQLVDFRNAPSVYFGDDLALHPRMNIFYGMNGSGKTTILDALAILLSWQSNRRFTPSASGRLLPIASINNRGNFCKIPREMMS